jgi:hypothetical protein
LRVWDIPVNYLCDKHLMGQHLEIHTIFNVISNNKKGYSKHPETLRWVGKLDELALVHEQTVVEMLLRDFNHKSPIDLKPADLRTNYAKVDPVWKQIHSLYRKNCECDADDMNQWYDLIGHSYEEN